MPFAVMVPFLDPQQPDWRVSTIAVLPLPLMPFLDPSISLADLFHFRSASLRQRCIKATAGRGHGTGRQRPSFPEPGNLSKTLTQRVALNSWLAFNAVDCMPLTACR